MSNTEVVLHDVAAHLTRNNAVCSAYRWGIFIEKPVRISVQVVGDDFVIGRIAEYPYATIPVTDPNAKDQIIDAINDLFGA